METLFGDLCCRKLFRHDVEIMELYAGRVAREGRKRSRDDSQTETRTTEDEITSPVVEGLPTFVRGLESEGLFTPNAITSAMEITASSGRAQISNTPPNPKAPVTTVLEPEHGISEMDTKTPSPTTVPFLSISAAPVSSDTSVSTTAPTNTVVSTPSAGKGRGKLKLKNRQIAELAAKRKYGLDWRDIGVISTRSKADQEELEL